MFMNDIVASKITLNSSKVFSVLWISVFFCFSTWDLMDIETWAYTTLCGCLLNHFMHISMKWYWCRKYPILSKHWFDSKLTKRTKISPSVRSLSFCKLLLLQNHWAKFIQTWHKASLGKRDSSLFKWRATPQKKEILVFSLSCSTSW